MIVQHYDVYADFVAATKEFKIRHVFWQPSGGPQPFAATAYVQNSELVLATTAASTPPWFSADFPNAVQLVVLPYLNRPKGQQF